MPKCLLCEKPAKHVEISPDGLPEYFCSHRHYNINRDYFCAKGIVRRSLVLRKINSNE